MSTLRHWHKQKLNEAYISEMANGRQDIIEVVQELSDILEEYNEEILGTEDGYLVEQKDVTKLSSSQLKKLFRASVAISQGKEPKEGLLSKVTGKAKAAKELAAKMMAALKKGAKKLQDTEPVQGFDMKVADALGKWKEKLGDDHKAVKMAQKLGEFGKEHPKKTAFIIAALTALTGFVGTPAFGAAAGIAMRGALGLAKGERASTVLGKAALVGGIGAAAGALADMLGDSMDVEVTGDEKVTKVQSEVDTAEIEEPDKMPSFYERFPTEDDFKQHYAEEIWRKSAGKWQPMAGGGEGLVYDIDTIQRMKEQVKVIGDYGSGNFKAKFDGMFVRGHYLSPDQIPEWQNLLRSQGGGLGAGISDAADQWLEQNAPKSKGYE